MRFTITVLFFGVLVSACGGSSGTSAGGTGGAGATTANGGTSTSGGGGAGGASTTSSGVGGVTPIAVVINEIRAIGEDYVELVNTGAEPFDLANHGLTDSDKMGMPVAAGVARFPAGTTLAPGDHLLVVAEQDAAAGVGPHEICLTVGGPATCYYVTWGISSAKGEKVFLLDPDDSLVGEVDYPMNAVPDGMTWGRLPDGTGPFAANAPTPGAANKAP